MTGSNNKISYLVNSQVPFFVRNDHPNFVKFLESYYEFLEQQGRELDTLKTLRQNGDIDTAIDPYLEKFYQALLKYIPDESKVDRSYILKHIKDFYRSRGTEKSVRFLMRLLFNEEVFDIYYPKNDVLRASAGRWFIEKSVKINEAKINGVITEDVAALKNIAGSKIVGRTSNASAIVENVFSYYEGGVLIKELKISNQFRSFRAGEEIRSTFRVNGRTRTFSANLFVGSINTVKVVTPGTGYSVGQSIPIESETGSGGVVIISSVTTGNIKYIIVDEGGSGFQVGNPVLLAGGGGSGAAGSVSLVDDTGTYHPNSYNIVYSTVSLEANTPITANSPYESFAYQNLATIYVLASNLTISTGPGDNVSVVTLSDIKSNSNVFFETYDALDIGSSIYLVTSANTITNTINVAPEITGNLSGEPFTVIKRANANTTLANGLQYFVYANTGPIRLVAVTQGGNNYTSLPTATVVANTRIRNLGILGSMNVVNSGTGYSIGDKIVFTNIPFSGSYGEGAAAEVSNVNGSGAITGVRFIQVPGHIIGGSGYSQELLPMANVVSGTGQDAIIEVTSVLGSGESLRPNTSTAGAIQEVTIIARGEGYETAPTLNLRGFGDRTANVTATIIAGTFTYPGRYLTDEGHLSGYNFLQNKDYYQDFSYVIKLPRSINDYRQAVRELVHPSGMKLFGEYTLIDLGETMDLEVRNTSSYYANTTYAGTYVATSNANGKRIVVTALAPRINTSINGTNVYLTFATSNTSNLVDGIYRLQRLTESSFQVYVANVALSGTVSANNGNGRTAILKGTGTNFTLLSPGDRIVISGYSNVFTVGAVSNSTYLTVTGNSLPRSLTGNTYYRIFTPANANGKIFYTSI